MPNTQTPTAGRIVLVPMDPTQNNGQPFAPAIITQAWNHETVNVRILSDRDETTPWRTSLTYVDDLAQLAADDPARLYSWTWPPRV